jgi:hypothetical protein
LLIVYAISLSSSIVSNLRIQYSCELLYNQELSTVFGVLNLLGFALESLKPETYDVKECPQFDSKTSGYIAKPYSNDY